MHFQEILVKDVRLNVERTLGLAQINFLSILWGANFVYRYSKCIFFFLFFAEQLVVQFFLFFVGAQLFRCVQLFLGKLRKPVPGCRVTDLPNMAKLSEGCKDLRILHPRTFT